MTQEHALAEEDQMTDAWEKRNDIESCSYKDRKKKSSTTKGKTTVLKASVVTKLPVFAT